MDLQNQKLDDTTTAATSTPLVQFNGSNDHVIMPKVRKPYTVSKQREKWTDEEHGKFLEALKLYGRAWRQIEEFVGTKTAVQIRSHAQKFFYKVAQGGNDNTESPVEAIEIPPPRPKRKPTHPYPRKLVDAQNTIKSPGFQSEKRMCPRIVNINTENHSPKSVLSAAMLQLESPISDMPDSCLSTSSGSTDLQSGSLFSINKEENLKSISSFQCNGKDVSPTIKRPASSVVDVPANPGIESFGDEASMHESTIILFGQIVSTKGINRPSSDNKDTCTPPKQHLAEDVDDKHLQLDELTASTSNGLDTHLSHPPYYGNWNPWSCASMQWLPLPLFNSLPPPSYHTSCSQAPASSLMEERTHGNELYSSTMKNHSTKDATSAANPTHSSVPEGDVSGPKRIYNSGFVPYQRCAASVISNMAKTVAEDDTYKSGFVPYQRCFANGNAKSTNTVAEDDGGQQMQLCL